MKNIFYSFLAVMLLGIFPAHAQEELDRLLETSLEDANILMEGYISPFMNAFGTGLTAGWYNTAKPHKTLGFDLTVTVNAARVPDSDFFYSVGGLNNTELVGGTEAPTLFGPDQTPTYSYTYTETVEGQEVEYTGTFDGPPGLGIADELGFNAVPVPMAQLGIGIVKNTDIKIRWTPEIEAGDATFKLLGFGVMHDVKQYIPGIKLLPFDLSAFVGYTSVSTTVDFSQNASQISSGVSTQNGQGVVDFNALTVQGIISKKISVLTLYGGAGFNRVRSNIAMEGDYEVSDGSGTTPSRTITNPIALDFQTGGPRVTAGFRLKLAILTIHADYTLQKYSMITGGVGLSIR